MLDKILHHLMMDEAPRNGMIRAVKPLGFSLCHIHFNIQESDILLPVIFFVNTFRSLICNIKM